MEDTVDLEDLVALGDTEDLEDMVALGDTEDMEDTVALVDIEDVDYMVLDTIVGFPVLVSIDDTSDLPSLNQKLPLILSQSRPIIVIVDY